jgi:Resolvase, N terminal domain
MKPVVPQPQRCAVYTRKSTEHNLDLTFNSLDAQREACEAYIKSQAHEGSRLVPDHYDDGGLSGASLDRPALQKLGTSICQRARCGWASSSRSCCRFHTVVTMIRSIAFPSSSAGCRTTRSIRSAFMCRSSSPDRFFLRIGGEKQASHFCFDRLHGRSALALGTENIAAPAQMRSAVAEFNDLLLQRDRWHVQMIPTALLQEVASEVVLMQALHDRNDGARLFVIEARDECAAIPVDHALTGRLRMDLIKLGSFGGRMPGKRPRYQGASITLRNCRWCGETGGAIAGSTRAGTCQGRDGAPASSKGSRAG